MIEGPVPEPSPGQVLVRVEAVGICGSDMHYYAEGHVGDIPCVYPMVIGHEPAGTVVKAGTGVTGWSPGGRVALEPAIYCYHCEFCHTGHHNVCANLRFMSMPPDPGFFAEYAVLPAENLIAIPPEISFADATLIEPLAVVVHSMKFIAVQPTDTAVIFGAGPIGLLTLVTMKLAGAGRIWTVEPVKERRELAARLGADVVIDPQEVDPVKEILAGTRNRGVDVAVDCAAKDNTMNQSILASRNAGRVVITGIPSESGVPLDIHTMRRKETTVYNVRRSNREGDLARDLMCANLSRFLPIITHTRPLDEIARTFAQLEHYEDGMAKAVILMK